MTTTSEISLPDRYDMLVRKAVGQMSQIIVPVDVALEHIDMLYSDMRASSRGIFLILRGLRNWKIDLYSHYWNFSTGC